MTATMYENDWEVFSMRTDVRWNRDIASADEMRAGIRRWVSNDGDVVTVIRSEVK